MIEIQGTVILLDKILYFKYDKDAYMLNVHLIGEHLNFFFGSQEEGEEVYNELVGLVKWKVFHEMRK